MENYGFIKLCYGVVGSYMDTSEMTTDEVVKEFLKYVGAESPEDFFEKQKNNTYGKFKQEFLKEENSTKVLKNAAGHDIIEVKKSKLTGNPPNSITQITNKKGGKDRNYNDSTGTRYKQVSNYGHGHKKEELMGLHGEHAHDYIKNKNGLPEHQKARELNPKERKENKDILWQLRRKSEKE